jgi:preprotein translocase subunit SecB
MELNRIATGIKLVGTTIKEISVENNIVNVQKEAKRSFGLNINEPSFETIDEGFFAQMAIDFEVEIEQSEDRNFKLELSLEGAFLSEKDTEEEDFKQLVIINGAAALISIARGKIESITSNIFDSGKVVIPFVNVIDYYKGLSE